MNSPLKLKPTLTPRERFEIGQFCVSQLRRYEQKLNHSADDLSESQFYENLYDKMRINEIAINELPKMARKKKKSKGEIK